MNTFENLRSGHGYSITAAKPDSDGQPQIFPEDTRNVIEITSAFGSCLIEAVVGAGKSHLVSDIGVLARSGQYEMPTLTMRAHISGGCKEGALNALRILDQFSEEMRDEGLIIVDNADYYGYSGSDGKRRYQCALRHIEVARYINDLTSDPEAPRICATAHDDEWRANHWLYGRREIDEVTPQAQALLDSFAGTYHFSGEIDSATAASLLSDRFGEAATEIAQVLGRQGVLSFLYASRIEPEGVSRHGVIGELVRIQEGREYRIRGLSVAETVPVAVA